MITKQKLIQDLKDLGIQKTDTLLVHSSMKAVGEVEGGADTVLDALMEVVSDGLLVLPTHSWATMKEDHMIFDPKEEPSCVGILTNLFLKRENVYRSLHPTHSVAAYGKDAKEFVQADLIWLDTPCPREGCWGELYDRQAKILLLGCGLNRNTYMHGVEEWNHIPERLCEQTEPMKVKMPDGSIKDRPMRRHYKPDGVSISEYYIKMEHIFLTCGIAKKGKVGMADCLICDAKKEADLVTRCLKENPNVFGNMEEKVPEIF